MKARSSMAQILTRRLALIAAVIVALNAAIVGVYYGSDQRALEAEMVAAEMERLQVEMEGARVGAVARAFYAEHPQAYAFALIDRSGVVQDSMNRHLIPPFAMDIYINDWITVRDTPSGRLLMAGHEFADRMDGLRAVFVKASDPAHLLRRAFVSEFIEHVGIPVLPMALLLIGASTVLIRRRLAPVVAAAAWARDLRPGAFVPPPPSAAAPTEITDLVEATQRALERLATALAAEARHAAEAAHALRTPVAVLVARIDALPAGETTDQLRADLAALSRTVQQVLTASRTDVLAMPDDTGCDLRQVATHVITTLAPYAHAKGVELALTQPEAAVMARANAEGVELALTNLIENAILHGGAGVVELSVGPGPNLKIRDYGPGLPKGAGVQIFKPFWRAPGAVSGGTGLGLAIVDRLQRAQGGNVLVQDPPDGGCEITLGFRPL